MGAELAISYTAAVLKNSWNRLQLSLFDFLFSYTNTYN